MRRFKNLKINCYSSFYSIQNSHSRKLNSQTLNGNTLNSRQSKTFALLAQPYANKNSYSSVKLSAQSIPALFSITQSHKSPKQIFQLTQSEFRDPPSQNKNFNSYPKKISSSSFSRFSSLFAGQTILFFFFPTPWNHNTLFTATKGHFHDLRYQLEIDLTCCVKT